MPIKQESPTPCELSQSPEPPAAAIRSNDPIGGKPSTSEEFPPQQGNKNFSRLVLDQKRNSPNLYKKAFEIPQVVSKLPERHKNFENFVSPG